MIKRLMMLTLMLVAAHVQAENLFGAIGQGVADVGEVAGETVVGAGEVAADTVGDTGRVLTGREPVYGRQRHYDRYHRGDHHVMIEDPEDANGESTYVHVKERPGPDEVRVEHYE